MSQRSSLVVLLIATGVLPCCRQAKEPESSAVAPAAVEVVTLKPQQLTSSINIPGEVVSFRDVDLYAKVNSFVNGLYADVGTQVKEGQLLATMEAPEIKSQLVAAESRLHSQEALFKASQANYDRLLATSKTPGTISQNDLDQALARMNSDKAQLDAAQAAQKEISVMQGYLEIRAPFSGIISVRNISLGAYVGPSGKGSEFPLFTLNEQSRLRLVVYVPEAETRYLHLNDEIAFTVKAFPNQSFTGKVKRLAGALDKKLRAQRIEMDVPNEHHQLLPGMIAEVRLALSSNPNSWIVPRSAVVNSTERIFIVRVKDQKAQWINVQTGLEAAGKVEVYGPLQEGDQVVVTASEEIREGSSVGAVKEASPVSQ